MSNNATSHDNPYITVCPVGCSAPLTVTTLALPEGPLRRCTDCAQLVSAASERRYWDTMAAFNAPDFNQPGPRELARRARVAQRRLRRICMLLGQAPAASHILDVGCSRGQFVAFARDSGFAAEGVEPAPDIAAAARTAGLTVHTGLLDEQKFPDAAFDALTLFEVVEHLREPLPLLRECARVLKPRGILLISTGNAASWTVSAMDARWDYFHIEKDGGHVSFFNPRSIARLAANAGFSVERIETARVKFHENGEVAPLTYALGKLVAELLNVPARLAGRGHDMLAYLRRS